MPLLSAMQSSLDARSQSSTITLRLESMTIPSLLGPCGETMFSLRTTTFSQ
jgi:hypothetical protein